MSEAVTVAEATRLLNTTQAALGSVIDQSAVSKLPLAIRNWDDLLALVPGVQGDRYTEQGGGTAVGRTGGVNVHGSRSLQNNFLLDGVDNNSISTNVQELTTQVSRPSVDAIQEFKVVTSPYSAEYGRAPGAAISVTTKSGTNEFHGTAYDYFRNDELRLEHYFNRLPHRARLAPLAKPTNDQNQFGGNLGGPIVKDRAFFFADYEGTRITRGVTRSTRVPTTAERAGIFTGTVRDPLTGQPFPNNTIPADRIDPVAAAIMALVPLPNTTGTNNFFRPDANLIDDADRLTGGWTSAPRTTTASSCATSTPTASGRIPGAFGGVLDGTGTSAFGNQTIKTNGLVGGWTRIFGPSVVNEFRFSWSAVDSDAVQQPFGQLPPRRGAGPGSAQRPAGRGRPPRHHDRRLLRRRGLGRIGSPDFLPKFQHTNQFEFLNTLSWLQGNHQLKFGDDIIAPMKNEYLDVPATRGALRFRNRFTGNAMADFLLGYGPDVQLSNVFVVDQRHWATSFFAGRLEGQPEADAQPRPALRLHHAGARGRQQPDQLRSGGERQPRVRDGRLARGPRPGQARQQQLRAARRGRLPGDDTLVVRGGYGIFYNLFDRVGSEDQLALNLPGLINNSLSTQLHHDARSSSCRTASRRTSSTRSQARRPPHPPARRRPGRAQDDHPAGQHRARSRCSRGLRRLARRVGTKGRNLATLVNLNQPLGGRRAPVPYPDFGFIEWREQNGTSSYKGIDLGLERRFSKGYGFGIAYTLADSTDKSAEHLSTGGSPSFPQNARNLDDW